MTSTPEREQRWAEALFGNVVEPRTNKEDWRIQRAMALADAETAEKDAEIAELKAAYAELSAWRLRLVDQLDAAGARLRSENEVTGSLRQRIMASVDQAATGERGTASVTDSICYQIKREHKGAGIEPAALRGNGRGHEPELIVWTATPVPAAVPGEPEAASIEPGGPDQLQQREFKATDGP